MVSYTRVEPRRIELKITDEANTLTNHIDRAVDHRVEERMARAQRKRKPAAPVEPEPAASESSRRQRQRLILFEGRVPTMNEITSINPDDARLTRQLVYESQAATAAYESTRIRNICLGTGAVVLAAGIGLAALVWAWNQGVDPEALKQALADMPPIKWVEATVDPEATVGVKKDATVGIDKDSKVTVTRGQVAEGGEGQRRRHGQHRSQRHRQGDRRGRAATTPRSSSRSRTPETAEEATRPSNARSPSSTTSVTPTAQL